MNGNGNGHQPSQPTKEQLREFARAPQMQPPLVTAHEFNLDDAKQPRPLSGNPYIKVGLIFGATLPIFMVAGLFLSSQSSRKREVVYPTAAPTAPVSEPSAATLVQEQREALGKAQANEALYNQRAALQPQPSPKTAPVMQPAMQKVSVRTVKPSSPPAAISRPVRVAPAIYSPPPSIGRTLPTSFPLVRSQSPAVSTTQPPQANYERYLALTNLGSYGQLPTPPEASTNASVSRDTDQLVTQRTLQPLPTINPEEEAPILQDRPRKMLRIATKGEAILITPLVWDEKTAFNQQSKTNRFTIQLTESLPAQDSSIAFPAGTQLVAQLESLSSSGLVQLQVVAAVVEQSGQRVELPLPEGSIRIRGTAGQPLIAERYGDPGGEVAAMDMGSFALGALSKAADQLTRPQSSSVVSSLGGIVSTTQNSQPNLLAGALQGGADALLSDLSRRNQQAMQTISQQPHIRFLPAGTRVEVYINQSIPLLLSLETGMQFKVPPTEPSVEVSPLELNRTLPVEELSPVEVTDSVSPINTGLLEAIKAGE